MVLTEVNNGGVFVNVRHQNRPRPGDEFIFRSKLLNADGDRVGSINGICTIVLRGKVLCQATVRLPGGTLSATAVSTEEARVTHIAINGGTGRYDRARGQVTSTTTGPNTSRDVIDLDF
jgi:hypothetical protein